MIVVMQPDATDEQKKRVLGRIESLGLSTHPIHGTNLDVIAAIGDRREVFVEVLEALPGVDRVLKILSPYKLASLETHKEKSVIPLGRGSVGGRTIALIAGPCTVESRAQILEAAKMASDAGAVALRGGAFKPRTSPYDFQGLMEEGLEYLAEAREKTGLAVVTEVMSENAVELVGKYADVFQIGARNMQNFHLLQAVGCTQKPVLLKRGASATLKEFLLAAEYIISQGNDQVILCERGIRTFEEYTRNTLPLAIVPELHKLTHLPVMVDPSHGTGRRHLVGPMSRAAVAVGCDGLLIEMHPAPDEALVDGAQSLSGEELATLVKELTAVARAIGRDL